MSAERPLAPPGFTLEEPGSYIYDGMASSRGYRLNRFCLSLKVPANRQAFLADELAYAAQYGLSAGEWRLVAERDWTGLLQAGGHLQAILKLAATLGLNLYHIGAHNVGTDFESMYGACPRKVAGLPERE